MGRFTCCSLSFLVVGFFLGGAKAACCPMEWLTYQGYCYKLFNNKLSWADAELACQFNVPSGHLASIHSTAESSELSRYIIKYRSDSGNVWIGMRDPMKNRVWVWSDQTSTSYKSWNDGEPNNQRNEEYCVEAWSPSGYKLWNDGNCKSERAYLCKYQLQ